MEYAEINRSNGVKIEITIRNPHNINPKYEANITYPSGAKIKAPVNPCLTPVAGKLRHCWSLYANGRLILIPHASATDAFED